MKFKKFIAAAAAIAVMSAQAAAFADFTDMPDGEMGTALANAVEHGLINGYDENTIAPNDLITRAQMAAIITRAFGAKDQAETAFKDVADNAWYKEDVAKAVAMSAFEGDENGNFNPDNNITFQETYTVLSRVFYLAPLVTNFSDGTQKIMGGVSKADIESFTDKDKVADWALLYAESIVKNGGWNGIDNQLKPLDNITRGEFALVMDKIVKNYVDEPGTYDNLPDGLTMVRSGGVTIKNLKTDRNLIISYGVDKTGCTVMESEVSGAAVILGGADVVEEKSESGVITKKKGTNFYVSFGGKFYDVRVMAPYINADFTKLQVSPGEYPNYYICKDSTAALPSVEAQ